MPMEQFFNDPEDVQWLIDTKLGGRTDLKFESFVLIGTEDCPEAVDLYVDRDPLVSDTPHRINFLGVVE